MSDLSEFEEIRPYSDDEAVAALARVSSNPILPVISKYLFSGEDPRYLSAALQKVSSIENFQSEVMSSVVSQILVKTSEGFTVSGIENLKGLDNGFIAFSNHRDIVLDPALILYTLNGLKMPCCELCIGSNLIQNQLVEDLMRSNRMIKVIRGVSARQLYMSSRTLSKYIRRKVVEDGGSVWIAQREGRTKDGKDATEQGLLKMFDLSGSGSFEQNFQELHIVPMSISYEYESCDSRKAREILLKKHNDGQYRKRPNEDLHSIMTGIRQQKGHIHLTVGKPLSDDEIESAAAFSGNDRYHALMSILDERINGGYKLWKTNYMGYDLMHGETTFLGSKYLPEDLEQFLEYTEHKLGKLESRLDRQELKDIFWHIYGNPVAAKNAL